MRRIFYLGSHQFEFFWWHEAIGEGERVLFEGYTAARDFLRSLLSGSFETGKLTALVLDRRRAGPSTAATPDSLVVGLARDIAEGRLIVTRAARVYPVSLGTKREEQPPVDLGPAVPIARRLEKEDWIEIELVDMEDNPIRNERWEITWPDGSTVSEGTTDGRGVGRIDWIDPSGMCQISFPDLDRRAWDRIT